MIDSPHLLAETFGPAELQNRKKSALIYWNFVRDDGVADFTLVARLRPKIKPSEVQVRLVANSGFRSFRDWAIDRLCAVEGGEETPLFINSEAFVIERLG